MLWQQQQDLLVQHHLYVFPQQGLPCPVTHCVPLCSPSATPVQLEIPTLKSSWVCRWRAGDPPPPPRSRSSCDPEQWDMHSILTP